MSMFSEDKCFPVKTYKSSIITIDDLKSRFYVVILPSVGELHYIDMVGKFNDAINGQITNILRADTGDMLDNVLVLSELIDRENDDLDYFLILYVKEYLHSYKISGSICKEKHKGYFKKFNDPIKIIKLFRDNIPKFDNLLDITGHLNGRRLFFTLSRNENVTVDKLELTKIIDMLLCI